MDIEKIIREYITKTVHMSLATVRDNKPWVCEVHFAYDNDLNLYFRSLKSRRHSLEIAENPNVSGNISPQYSLEEGCGGAIYFEGQAQLLETEPEIRSALPAFEKCLGKDEDIVGEALTEDGHKVYKVTVENWYAFGKFGQEESGKYELRWHKRA